MWRRERGETLQGSAGAAQQGRFRGSSPIRRRGREADWHQARRRAYRPAVGAPGRISRPVGSVSRTLS